MKTKKSLKDKVQRGVKSIVPAMLIAAGSLGNIDSAQAQNSNESNDSNFRFNLGGGAKYENASGLNQYATASPQFNLNKNGKNAVWLGPYFTKNFGNKNTEEIEKGPFSKTSLVDRESEIERSVDSSYETISNINKPYGFGLNLTYGFGKDNNSELEFKAGLTKKNTSTNKYAEKSITYSRNNEVLRENTISDTDESSGSELVPSFGVGYEQFFGDSKTFSLEGFAGYSESMYGGLGVNIYLGGKKGENER